MTCLAPLCLSWFGVFMCRLSRLGRVSPCNNTVFSADRLIKDAPGGRDPLPCPQLRRIFGAMTDATHLARRFLALWEDYLTALFADPSQSELLQAWLDAASGVSREREPGEP